MVFSRKIVKFFCADYLQYNINVDKKNRIIILGRAEFFVEFNVFFVFGFIITPMWCEFFIEEWLGYILILIYL